MYQKIRLAALAIALCGFVSTVPVKASVDGITPITEHRIVLGFHYDRNTSIYPTGPEADLYLEHYHSARVAVGFDDKNASIYPPGPEADLYLQHYHGAASVAGIDNEHASFYPRGLDAVLYLPPANFARADAVVDAKSAIVYPPGLEAVLHLPNTRDAADLNTA